MKEVSKMKNFLSLDYIDTTNVGNTMYIHKFPMNFHLSTRQILYKVYFHQFSHL